MLKNSGDHIAQAMNGFMESESFKKIFKSAQDMSMNAYDKDHSKDHSEAHDKHSTDKMHVEMRDLDHVHDDSCDADCGDVKDEDMVYGLEGLNSETHEAKEFKEAHALKAAADVLLSISEYCDDVGLDKTASLSVVLAEILVKEAKVKKDSKKDSKKDVKKSKLEDSKKKSSDKDVKKSKDDDKKKPMSSKKHFGDSKSSKMSQKPVKK